MIPHLVSPEEGHTGGDVFMCEEQKQTAQLEHESRTSHTKSRGPRQKDATLPRLGVALWSTEAAVSVELLSLPPPDGFLPA